jgi:predicted amidohydrolase
MKEKVKASLVQFTPEWLQTEKNAERMRDICEKEAKKGVELIVFPELANVGYVTPAIPGLPASFDAKTSALEFGAKFVKASEPVPGPTTENLSQVTRKYGIYVVVGMSRLHPVIPYTVYNSAVLLGPSGVVGIYDKVHIAVEEKHYFYPGDRIEVYKTDLGNIGMAICYDNRFPELTRILALKGAEIVCSMYNIVKVAKLLDPDSIKYRARTRAAENLNYNLACSRGGKEGDISFVGHSTIAAPNGDVIAYTDSEEEDIVTGELYDEEIARVRSVGLIVFQDRRPDLYSAITEPLSKPFRTPTMSDATPTNESLKKSSQNVD